MNRHTLPTLVVDAEASELIALPGVDTRETLLVDRHKFVVQRLGGKCWPYIIDPHEDSDNTCGAVGDE